MPSHYISQVKLNEWIGICLLIVSFHQKVAFRSWVKASVVAKLTANISVQTSEPYIRVKVN